MLNVELLLQVVVVNEIISLQKNIFPKLLPDNAIHFIFS